MSIHVEFVKARQQQREGESDLSEILLLVDGAHTILIGMLQGKLESVQLIAGLEERAQRVQYPTHLEKILTSRLRC